MVNSGNFGHQVNWDINLQTVEIHMNELSLSDSQCLLSKLIFIPIIEI